MTITLSDKLVGNMVEDYHIKNSLIYLWGKINERTEKKAGVSPNLRELREMLKETFGDKLIK